MAKGPELVSEHGLGQGGRGIGGVAGSVGPVDWSSLLGQAGLPKDVVAQLDRIFTRTTDINQAVAIGQAYLRSTPWYAQTFPGIQSGINSGLIHDEQGYRSYANQLSQLYRQYLSRPPTAAEVAQHLVQGQPVDLIGKQLAGNAYVQANLPEINQTLGAFGDTGAPTKEQLTALGQEQAGLDTAAGQRVTVAFDRAVRRMQGVFKGTLSNPALSLVNGRPVGRQAGVAPDVAA